MQEGEYEMARTENWPALVASESTVPTPAELAEELCFGISALEGPLKDARETSYAAMAVGELLTKVDKEDTRFTGLHHLTNKLADAIEAIERERSRLFSIAHRLHVGEEDWQLCQAETRERTADDADAAD